MVDIFFELVVVAEVVGMVDIDVDVVLNVDFNLLLVVVAEVVVLELG